MTKYGGCIFQRHASLSQVKPLRVKFLTKLTAVWPHRGLVWFCLLATGASTPAGLEAVTLRELTDRPEQLTPKKFAAYFSDYAYEFNSRIQPPEVFVARERGDCDDYSALADYVLRRHHYSTRLIHVRLAGRVAHAVCYVSESRVYLDYNNRAVFFSLTKSGPALRDIADKVASSLEASWTTASEFTYSYESGRKTMITTIAQTGSEVANPGSGPSQTSPFNVN